MEDRTLDKHRCIDYKNLPAKIPFNLVVIALVLDRFDVPGWGWGIFIAFAFIIQVGILVQALNQKCVDIFEKEN